MGFGAALIMPTSIAVLTNVFTDARERGRALGVWSAFAGLGIALGPVLGGLLLSRFWWGSVFLVNVPLVVVVLAISWWAVPESRNPGASQFDPLGVVLSVVGVSALVWATIQAPTEGWGSATTLRSFAVAIVLIGCLVLWELRCAHPMLELKFFRNPRFSVASVASGTANFAFAGSIFVLTQLLQFVFGYSPLSAGFALVPMAASFMIAGLLGPRLAERIGSKRAVALALAIFAIGLVVLATANEDSGFGIVLVATLTVGVGFGFTLAPTTDAVMGAVPREKAGMASGTLSATRQVATAIGVAVVGSLLVSGYRSELATRTRGLALSHTDLHQRTHVVGLRARGRARHRRRGRPHAEQRGPPRVHPRHAPRSDRVRGDAHVRCAARAPLSPRPCARRARDRRARATSRSSTSSSNDDDDRRHRAVRPRRRARRLRWRGADARALRHRERRRALAPMAHLPVGAQLRARRLLARRTSRPASSSDWDLPITPDEFLDGFGNWLGGPLAGSDELVSAVRSRVPVGCLSNTNSLHWERHFSQWPLLARLRPPLPLVRARRAQARP